MKSHLRIGITAGDVNGIGPEVAIKALVQGARKLRDVEFILIGDLKIWRAAGKAHRHPGFDIWNPAPHLKVRSRPGAVHADASMAAAEWIRAGAQACLDGHLDAIVTGPICKEGFQLAGIRTPGHTEMLADITGAKRYAMMLVGGPLRVVLATRHIPLADVPKQITRSLLTGQIQLTHEALGWMGLRKRRMAVCGLNPHAGEHGNLGREEIHVIGPAIEKMQQRGMDVQGPRPGDTVFHEAASGRYDAVVAMYHDQGLAPLKLIAFDSGVNITLGLPIVRTSPDHGTAFDLAGKNKASPASMMEAILAAVRLARRPNPWKHHG